MFDDFIAELSVGAEQLQTSHSRRGDSDEGDAQAYGDVGDMVQLYPL